MTEMVTSGSMSGEGKRSDGLLGESDPERCCSHSAPPALHATALLFDSTSSVLGILGPFAAAMWYIRKLGAADDKGAKKKRDAITQEAIDAKKRETADYAKPPY